jgi:coenzyme F420-reducing hydrogenase beta subunit
VVTIGLVCGQLKSRHFTDYIAAFARVRGKVTGVRYRGKSPEHSASNYHYAFKTENGEERRIFWREGIAEAWMNRWFTPDACNYCDDIFAECADVTCMDAWLPEYSKDIRGTSLVLVRSPLVGEVVAQGQGICLDAIPAERVVQSQSGVVAFKRQHLAYRLHLDRENGQKVPGKRVAPERPKNPLLRLDVVLKERMRVVSKDLWAAGMTDTKRLGEEMRPTLWQLAAVRHIAKVITFPLRIFRYTKGKIRSSHYE